MGNFNDIGQLKELPMDSISVKNKANNILEYSILATASEIEKIGNYNPVPVIVTSIGSYKYEVVSNHLTYYACKHLGFEKIYCIVVENDNKIKRLCLILNSELSPKINLTTASREEISSSLRYVKEQFKLSKFDIQKATIRITDSPLRKYWESLDEILNLKCGITIKNLQFFHNVYELHPLERPKEPSKVFILNVTEKEILERLSYLKEVYSSDFTNVDIEIATRETKNYINSIGKKRPKNISFLTKLDIGIDKKCIGRMKEIFLIE